MSADWPIITLGEVCLKITDGAHNSPKSVAVGKPMASVKDLTRFGVDLSEARHISQQDYETLVRQGCRPEVGDVLIAKDGNSALDTVCNIKRPLDAVLLSSVAILRPDQNVVDSDFLKFFLSSKETIDYLKSNFISGAAIPRIVLKDFKKAKIKLPPLETQKDISAILNSVDDKIELNRQINQTLEQIAQAIFKSWFVDFEPVKAKIEAKQTLTPALSQREGEDIVDRAAMRAISGKTDAELDQLPPEQRQQLAATAALFPDELVESELGLIPKGWTVTTLTEMVQLIGGGTPKRSNADFWNGNIPWFSVQDAPADSDVFVVDTEEK
ncbi:MAG: restriction endonuclease subunit S, partial [Deltaproteobacteria bacterium]|nr:restriction endonuclease subunit S [Deltaproteobacteria bacterium]